MGSNGEVNATARTFFVEASWNLEKTQISSSLAPKMEDQPGPVVNTFDNRGKFSDFLSEFRSQFQKFQTRLSTNSFISDSFTRLIKTARTSDSDKILAKASSLADEKDYSIDIKSLAGTRNASSNTLVSNVVTSFDAGTYSFDLTVGSTSYSPSVEIDKTVTNPDTNKDVLRKIQSAIDGVDSNIEAFVSEVKRKDFNPYAENVYERASYLTVRSKSTGEEVDFSLQDTSGDLIEKLELDKIRSYGRKNQYTVNGINNNANSNDISLDSNRLSAVLLDTTTNGAVNVKVRGGTPTLEKELLDIVADYNNLIEWLDDNRRFVSPDVKIDLFKDVGSTEVKRRVLQSKDDVPVVQGDLSSTVQTEISGTIDHKLIEIGLKLNNDGGLEISDDFSSALNRETKGVYETLAGEKGFFTKIKSAIDDILAQSGEKYILEYSVFLTYDSQGENKQKIYRDGVSQLFSLYA